MQRAIPEMSRIFPLAHILFVVLFVASGASADENADDSIVRKWSSKRAATMDISLNNVAKWAAEFQNKLHVDSDPVLRAIVCRVPFSSWSVDAIKLATKIPDDRLNEAIKRLSDLELIASERKNGVTTLIPASEEAKNWMQKYAVDMCATDVECGIER